MKQNGIQVEKYQYYNLSVFWRKRALRVGQAEEKLRLEKFSASRIVPVLPGRCLRGKVLFNFVWFDVKLASCHFHPVCSVVWRRVVPNNICFTPILKLLHSCAYLL